MGKKQHMIEAGNVGKDKVWVGFPDEVGVYDRIKKPLSGAVLHAFQLDRKAARAVIEMLEVELERLDDPDMEG